MTTKLTKPVARDSNELIRDRGKMRSLIITVYPNGMIGLRMKGCRTEETISMRSCYDSAIKQRVMAERREKQLKRKEGRR